MEINELPKLHSDFSVDCVIFGFDKGELKILLIERAEEPFKNFMALPGNFVYDNEDIDGAAGRILRELTSLSDIYLEQLYTFGEVNRHPQGRIITVAYFALIKVKKHILNPQVAFARKAEWYSVADVPALAFDHSKIFEKAYKRLQSKIRYQPIGFELLPEKFTLSQLQQLYEVILEKPIDKRNFRKKILSFGLLVELDEKQKNVSHRAAKLYKFNKSRYNNLKKMGFSFEL
ncbi:NUDIX hydrolase [Solitalea koreensis]|uniref:8-oxo-dGTP diphosphatase n=1 Tax=Solitalea koreensis TaxID=543615 RepID=A0A521E5S5_9SPHI|nr:NUDIX domain-containing protein [Solitalea koreensis]SMO79212.1 8-oxo-dGTP diphosphatase [Solitalea koreensis]